MIKKKNKLIYRNANENVLIHKLHPTAHATF